MTPVKYDRKTLGTARPASRIIVLAFTATLFLLTAFDQPGKKEPRENTPPPSLLAQYGALLYERENCGNCHSLDSAADETKVSLVNRGGTRPMAWYYNLLIHPLRVYPDGRMPGFPHLRRQALQPARILKNLPELNDTMTDSLYSRLQQEAAGIARRLAEEGITDEISPEQEVVALIAFLEMLRHQP